MLASAALISILCSGPAVAGGLPEQAVTLAATGRTRLNFNADWRFKLGSHDGAQGVAFDDRGWDTIGLPHSFSIPYFRAPDFYTGDGWYRKTFALPALTPNRRLSLEFEGAFQDARVFVNGIEVAHHRGGYTGFPVDITNVVQPGRNLVAVRVNNEWQATLAPRAGEHVFSGGLYRDVWLVASDAVHVPWTGTRVTTPNLSAASGRVAVETEVRNDSDAATAVTVRTRIVDARGRTIAVLPDAHVSVASRTTAIAKQISAPVSRPRLWSPETPTLYRAATTLLVAHHARDHFETEFGFRWIKWTADQGFFLNGQHRYFRGANVHQDQAGWGDAVTNGAIDRDVRLIKDAGFDFIRGSHYPHDPHFAEATDRIGMLLVSEAPFWGTAWFDNDWSVSAYPTDPAHRADFDASVKQQLAEMIRINRNHPSIIAWSMDNEVFFSAQETMGEVRRLLREQVELTHRLDPTRSAAVSGAQRGEIDKIGDIAGYNGDGAVLFPNPGLPNFVAEYGSTMADRPGDYAPGWGDLPNTPGARLGGPGSWRFPWRSGEAIWAGFDHGSIAGRKFGGMGLVDYFRLPKRQWYWYRNAYRGIAPGPWPRQGKPVALRLAASSSSIARADGTDDVQLIVSVLDAAGRRLSNSPPVHLAIESGPGELPTGRSIDFAPDSDIEIRDGEAAIAMRTWQSGTTRLRATSPGLKDAFVEVRTIQGQPFEAGKTPLVADRPYVAFQPSVRGRPGDGVFGLNNPTSSSSNAPGHSSRLVNDGNDATYWAPAKGDAMMAVTVDMERVVEIHGLSLTFPEAAPYGFLAEVQDRQGNWHKLAELHEGQERTRNRTIETDACAGRMIRIRLRVPAGAVPGLSEVQITGALQTE
jgi:hypothetical protein